LLFLSFQITNRRTPLKDSEDSNFHLVWFKEKKRKIPSCG